MFLNMVCGEVWRYLGVAGLVVDLGFGCAGLRFPDRWLPMISVFGCGPGAAAAGAGVGVPCMEALL